MGASVDNGDEIRRPRETPPGEQACTPVFSRIRQKQDMTQSLICAIAHIVGTWLAASGKVIPGRSGHKERGGSPGARTEHSLHDRRALVAQVNSRYFLSDEETYVSLRIMYIEVRQGGQR